MSFSNLHPMSVIAVLAEAASGRQAVDKLVAQLVALPELSSPQIPDLHANIDTLKSEMKNYQSHIAGEMTDVYNSIEGFNGAAQKSLADVSAAISKAPTPNDANTVSLVRGQANTLAASAMTSSDAVKRLNSALQAFSGQIETSTRALLADEGKAKAQIVGDNTRINAMNQQINALRDKVSRLKSQEIWCGILTFGICTAVMEAEHTVQHAESDLSGTKRELAGDRADSTRLTGVLSALNGISGSALTLVEMSNTLVQAWQAVDADLAEIQNAKLPSKLPLIFLQAGYQRMAKDWETVAQAAQQLKP